MQIKKTNNSHSSSGSSHEQQVWIYKIAGASTRYYQSGQSSYRNACVLCGCKKMRQSFFIYSVGSCQAAIQRHSYPGAPVHVLKWRVSLHTFAIPDSKFTPWSGCTLWIWERDARYGDYLVFLTCQWTWIVVVQFHVRFTVETSLADMPVTCSCTKQNCVYMKQKSQKIRHLRICPRYFLVHFEYSAFLAYALNRICMMRLWRQHDHEHFSLYQVDGFGMLRSNSPWAWGVWASQVWVRY